MKNFDKEVNRKVKEVTDDMERHLLNGINLLANLYKTYKAACLQHKL
jgi:hypothetical protein